MRVLLKGFMWAMGWQCVALLVGSTYTAQAGDEKPCCGKQPAAQGKALKNSATRKGNSKSGQNMQDTHVCPRYIWGYYGTYCDWYAMMCPSGMPTSYSTSCTHPPAYGACADLTNCDSISKISKKGDRSVLKTGNKHQGVDGYPGKKLTRKTKQEIEDKVLQSNDKITSSYITDFVVAFPLQDIPGSQPVYAQVIVARVTPNDPTYPSRFFASAFEIEKPGLAPLPDPKIVVGRPDNLQHAVNIRNGVFEAIVITHEKTPRTH